MIHPEIHFLPNKLCIVYQHHPESAVTHCGLLMRAGTRDELPGKEGLAHFIEHNLFKGTAKRKAIHILNRLEVVGGELNAYTTKEETCLHASVMNRYFERALELIADIALHSVFPEKEIEKEKDVISDEIRSYQDTPYEQIFDDFESQLFKGHTLGHPILGTEDSIRKFRKKDLLEFTARMYDPAHMVFAVSGNIGAEQVLKLVSKYMGHAKTKRKVHARKPVRKYSPALHEMTRNINQVHYIMGRPAFGLRDPRRYTLVLLNNLLGGPGMNSRLNLNIREKYGFTYTIESGYHTYSDTGIFHVYFATDEKHFERTRMLMEKELEELCRKRIGETQFRQYKEQLLGQIQLAQENRLSVLLSMAKSQLNLGKVITLSDITARIAQISAGEVLEVAGEIFHPAQRSVLVYKPK
ncbi:MAG: insulinase family protein [Bacteroidia bacterium]|nr:insulinase family protein [Bacteroidia bacterium]